MRRCSTTKPGSLVLSLFWDKINEGDFGSGPKPSKKKIRMHMIGGVTWPCNLNVEKLPHAKSMMGSFFTEMCNISYMFGARFRDFFYNVGFDDDDDCVQERLPSMQVPDSFNEGFRRWWRFARKAFSIRVSNNFNERLKTTIMTIMMLMIYAQGRLFSMCVSDSFYKGLMMMMIIIIIIIKRGPIRIGKEDD